MAHPVVLKLKRGADLSVDDTQALVDACSDVMTVPGREDLIEEGARPSNVHVVLEGFACRYKVLPDGGRQIMAWLVPGDFCDLHVAILGRMDHSIATLTPSKIARIGQDVVDRLTSTSPALGRALWWATLVDEGILREWLTNMGRRPADKQIAHLFCELLVRLRTVGLVEDDEVFMPLTQNELADSVGLSTVHVNRVVQELREKDLIAWQDKRLKIRDVPRLMQFAEFDPTYLHLSAVDEADRGAGRP